MQTYTGNTRQHNRQSDPPPPDGPVDELDLHCAGLELNDLGNGQRMIARYGQDFLHDGFDSKRPFWTWNGATWVRADAGVRQMAHDTQQAIYQEADAAWNVQGKKRMKALKAWAVETGDSRRLNGMVKEAIPYVSISPQEMDARTDLLPVQNGTLEFLNAAGEGCTDAEVVLREHRRGDRMTKVGGVEYDPQATCPRFLAFLDQVQPDRKVQAFLQRWFGLALTGQTTQHILLNYGLGANGKSTFMNVMRAILGDFAITLRFESVCESDTQNSGAPTPDKVRMINARLVLAAEPPQGARLSDAIVKEMTGGEPLTVRPLYGPQFEFAITHKTVLTFNNPPKVTSGDEGTWRRLPMAGWNETIPEQKRVVGLDRTLVDGEGPGILNWLVEGWLDYQRQGLGIPASVWERTQAYRAESNPVSRFAADCLDRTDPAMAWNTSAKEMFQTYQDWCKHNAMQPVHQNSFGRQMTTLGFERSQSGVAVYRNVRVKSDLPFKGDTDGQDTSPEPPPHGDDDLR